MVPGRGPWSRFLSWGKVDEVTPQVPPALAVLSWCIPDLKHNLCSPSLPGVGLAVAARPASVLRRAEKVSGPLLQLCNQLVYQSRFALIGA